MKSVPNVYQVLVVFAVFRDLGTNTYHPNIAQSLDNIISHCFAYFHFDRTKIQDLQSPILSKLEKRSAHFSSFNGLCDFPRFLWLYYHLKHSPFATQCQFTHFYKISRESVKKSRTSNNSQASQPTIHQIFIQLCNITTVFFFRYILLFLLFFH